MKVETIFKAFIRERPTGYYYYVRRLTEDILGLECLCKLMILHREVRAYLGMSNAEIDLVQLIQEMCRKKIRTCVDNGLC